MSSGKARLLCAGVTLVLLSLAAPAGAYIEAAYTLGRLVQESTWVVLVKAEKVDTEKNAIIYRKVQDIKGKAPADIIKHNIGKGGFHPREWQTIMATVQPGKVALIFSNGSASETCIDSYWYQCYPGGEWWRLIHAEPYLLRSYAGRPEKLAEHVTQMLAGKEVIVPCMVDGDKNALQLRTAKIQRMKASIAKQDYDPKRDFAGWGGDELRHISSMPGFEKIGDLGRVDPFAGGIAVADIDADGQMDLCLWGEEKVSVLRNAGNAFESLDIAHAGGARSACWGDWNGDKLPDLLIASPRGLKLFTNDKGKLVDSTSLLPQEPYYNLSSAAFVDYDGDGKLDILAANGFLGLRLYRNLGGVQQGASAAASSWYYAGPFDNPGGTGGFDKAYPPEQGVSLGATYPGRNNEPVTWKKADLKDGQVNSLAELFKPEHRAESVAYLYREIDLPVAMKLPVSLGSDDSLVVWINGQKIVSENVARSCVPDSTQAVLPLKAGKNTLLVKVGQGSGEWAFYIAPKSPLPASVARAFEDVSDRVGLGSHGLAGDVKGKHLAIADVNGDKRPDFLYSAGSGILALNTPKGFVPAADCGISFKPGAVAPIFADCNGDGHPDLLVSEGRGCRLFRNDGKGKFADVTAASGDLGRFDGFAGCAIFADFDKSGRMDLFVGCLKGINRYYRNNGAGVFSDATEDIGFHRKVFNTRGLCAIDLNKDGVADLAFTNEGQESTVLLSAVNRVPPAPKP